MCIPTIGLVMCFNRVYILILLLTISICVLFDYDFDMYVYFIMQICLLCLRQKVV